MSKRANELERTIQLSSRKRYYVRAAVETSRPNYTEAGQVTYGTREQCSKQPLMCLKQITLQRALTLKNITLDAVYKLKQLL